MPNHFHGIVWIVEDETTTTTTPNVLPRSLGAIVRGFKCAVAKRINQIRGTPVWQRNYYEHIVRDERGLNAIREYILNNPANWSSDTENV
jgi:putative transposase